MKKANNKINSLLKNSFFIAILVKISDFFFDKILTCRFAKLFCSYDSVLEKSNDSFFKRIVDRIKPSAKTVLKLKNSLARKIENSFAYKIYNRFLNFLLGCKAKMHGAFLIVYGLFSVCVGFIERYAFDKDGGFSVIYQGAVLVIVALPLLFTKSSMGSLLVNGRISSKIIEFFDFKKENILRNDSHNNMALPICVALVFGLSSFFVQPVILMLILILLAVLFLILHKPEIGVVATVTLLPFTPTMLICAEIILVTLAYLLKLLRGKRTFRIEVLDLTVLAFFAFTLLGGLFSVAPSSSLPPACVYACFISFYFVIVNLVRTTLFAKKILSCSLVSCAFCSFFGIYQNFFAAPDTTWTDEDMFSDIETRVVSTFENPNVFGEYLILLIPICITLFILSKKISGKGAHLICLFSAILALIYTWSRGAWLGCIASMIIFLIIINKRAISVYLLGVLSLPLTIPLLPSSILERFSSIGNMTDSSTSYRVFIWEASVNMIKDYFLTGIGIGTTAFQTIYSEYALSGIETAPHSHNLYLQIFIELGVFGILLFVALIFLFLSKVFTFIKNSRNYNAKIISGALMCGIIAFLLQGITDYVWYNYRVFAFFWMILAICVAHINSASCEDAENNEVE